MPPIFNFHVSSVPTGFSAKASGSTTMDGAASQTVVTGLSSPIQLLFVQYKGPLATNDRFFWKTKSMPGRAAYDSSAILIDAIGFVNGGLDFDVRNDDNASLNLQTGPPAGVLSWLAFA